MEATIRDFFQTLPVQPGGLVRRKAINEHLASRSMEWADVKHILENQTVVEKPKRGTYGIQKVLAELNGEIPAVTSTAATQETQSRGIAVLSQMDVYIPEKNPNYVRWGNHRDIEAIVKSLQFFPTYLMGDSGFGKTELIKQVCAEQKRQFVRIQISEDTDEDDLIGGLRIVDGDTVFAEGPVIRAMRDGALLLIDEIDRGTNKIMCLQGILEGQSYMIKRTGEVVHPHPSFNIIATGNTDGRGDYSGRFAGAGILDEAFLERFAVMIEQGLPTEAVDRKVVTNEAKSRGIEDATLFIDCLVEWSRQIRDTRPADGSSPLISLRRLIKIVQCMSIFKDEKKAVEYGIQRFEESDRTAYLTYWDSIRPNLENQKAAKEAQERQDALAAKAKAAAERATT